MMNAKRKPVAPGILVSQKGQQRMAVLAYPFEGDCFWLDPIKQRQLQGLLAWLAGGTLPALVEGAPDVCPVVLEDAESRTRVISLINCSTMRMEGFILRVEAPLTASRYRVTVVSDSGKVQGVPPARYDRKSGYLVFSMKNTLAVDSFDVRTLRIQAD